MIFFGRNLRYLREKHKLTQDEIASCIGVTNTTWSNYENGVSQPSMEGLIKISNYLGITIDELILGDIPAQDGHAVKQRKHKPYVVNDTTSVFEEELNYLTKEIRRLKKDVEEIKRANNK
jgi:transcriptional regulator with XRE-family HTH domain